MRATEEEVSAAAGAQAAQQRPAVHAASGTRLGDAHPRQEGPTDLRLVPPALAAWGTAALMVHASTGWVTGVVGACLMVGLALLVPWQGDRAGAGVRTRAGDRRVRRGAGAWTKVSVAAVLLCGGAAAASAGLHGADLRRGPVPALAEEYARVTADVELTSDPRLTRPRINGNHAAPTAVLLQAEVRRVQSPDGTVVDTRTPVLVMVDAEARRVAGLGASWVWLGFCRPRGCGWRRGSCRPWSGETGSRPCCGYGAGGAPVVVAGAVGGRSGSRGACVRGCGRRPTGWTRTRGRCCRGWSSGTPRGSRPSWTRRSRRPTSRICWLLAGRTSRSCSPCSSDRRGWRSGPNAGGSRPGSGIPLRTTALARRCAHARLRDRVPAGPERAAGRGLRIRSRCWPSRPGAAGP